MKLSVLIPAYNEEQNIGKCLAEIQSVLKKEQIPYEIIVVNDNSTDGTADAARSAANNKREEKRLSILTGAALPDSWVGKMWAVSQGVAAAGKVDYLLLTDADIVHAPD
ncbi:MAG: glycosyltransferase, partial [Marinoscillum sp.]